MSYSRTVNPGTSRAQRGRGRGRGGRAAANSYHLRPVNQRPPPSMEPEDQERQYGSSHNLEGQPTVGADYSATASATASAESRSLQSRGTFYVLPPDTQKNSKLKRTAEEEASEFERHKAAKRQETALHLSQHQPPAAVGGYSLSKRALERKREEQERQQQMEARFAKVRQREKREEYRRQQREKEEKEYKQKKQVQREKAKSLEAKRQWEQLSQQEEMRRKRLEKFDK